MKWTVTVTAKESTKRLGRIYQFLGGPIGLGLPIFLALYYDDQTSLQRGELFAMITIFTIFFCACLLGIYFWIKSKGDKVYQYELNGELIVAQLNKKRVVYKWSDFDFYYTFKHTEQPFQKTLAREQQEIRNALQSLSVNNLEKFMVRLAPTNLLDKMSERALAIYVPPSEIEEFRTFIDGKLKKNVNPPISDRLILS